MFGLLAGTLNGAAFGKDVVDFNVDFKTSTNTGQFIVAIDIAAFGDVDAFKQNVDNIYRAMKASPTLPGYDEGSIARRTKPQETPRSYTEWCADS